MTIIKIDPYETGMHITQFYPDVTDPRNDQDFTMPEGYAIITDDIRTLKNFPYGEIEVSEVDGLLIVTKWTPLPISESIPEKSNANDILLNALIG